MGLTTDRQTDGIAIGKNGLNVSCTFVQEARV